MEKINSLEDVLKAIKCNIKNGKLLECYRYETPDNRLHNIQVSLEHEVYSEMHGVNNGFPGGLFASRKIDFCLQAFADSKYSLNISDNCSMVSAFINDQSMLDSKFIPGSHGSSTIEIPTLEPKGYILRIYQHGL